MEVMHHTKEFFAGVQYAIDQLKIQAEVIRAEEQQAFKMQFYSEGKLHRELGWGYQHGAAHLERALKGLRG